MEVKMYKSDLELLYFEMWYDEKDNKIYFHEGKIGEYGDSYNGLIKDRNISPSAIIENIKRDKEKEGYQSDWSKIYKQELVLQYKLSPNSYEGRKDLEIREKVKDIIQSILSATSNGYVTDALFEEDLFNVFFFVFDIQSAVFKILKLLEFKGYLQDMNVIAKLLDSYDYEVIYPLDYSKEFRLGKIL